MRELFLKLTFFSLLFTGIVGRAFCVTPMVEYNDLVAGAGDADYRDGAFSLALFHQPTGLAIDPDGSRLFVADTSNNRLRVVLLDQSNLVQTIAGNGAATLLDGALDKCAFNLPQFVSFIDKNDLLVYDSGDGFFRWVNLTAGTVSTPGVKTADGQINAHFDNVGGMLFRSKENALYFTQRGAQTSVERLDLKTNVCSPVSLNAPLKADWGPICDYLDHVCIADKNSGTVYQLEPGANTITANFSLIEIGKGENIAVMASMGTTLYGVPARSLSSTQQTGSWMQIAPSNGAGQLPLMEVWGDEVSDEKLPMLSYLFAPNYHFLPYGFVADPRDEKRFYLSLPHKNVIMSLRDYRFDQYKLGDASLPPNENGIPDFDYPVKKPPHTFRILITGDSHIFAMGEHKDGDHRMEILAKRLELILNTMSTLVDSPVHFQVLNFGHADLTNDELVWFNYHVPQVVKKFDVDLCVKVVKSTFLEYMVYFRNPLTSEGIPQESSDEKYFSRSYRDRAGSSPLLKDFFDRCVKAKLGSETRVDGWRTMPHLLKNPGVRNDLLDLYGKPFGLLSEKVRSIKTSSGNSVDFFACFLPVGNIGTEEEALNEPSRLLWKDICEKEKVHFVDLSDPINTLKVSYYDTGEFMPPYHFNHKGQLLNAIVLAHELIHEKLIPMSYPSSDK